jgi:hypothetical protein
VPRGEAKGGGSGRWQDTQAVKAGGVAACAGWKQGRSARGPARGERRTGQVHEE